MKKHSLYASQTLARLYARQGYHRQAEAIWARLDNTLADPGRVKESGQYPDGQSLGPDAEEISRLAAHMARWLDLVARYRFYNKDRHPKI